jgi:hypothetical protein
MTHGNRLDARERDLGPRFGGADELLGAVPSRPLRGDQRARYGAQPAVERKLTDRGVPRERAVRDLVGGLEHRQGDGQVEAGSLLSQVGGSEVDRDPVLRELQLGRLDAAAHPLLGLLTGAVSQPDDGEGGRPALQMGLDLDPSWVEPDKGVGDGSRQHVGKIDDDPAAFVPTS